MSAAAVTRDGVTVRVGQVWRDLDVRMGGRTCVIVSVNDEFAFMRRSETSRSTQTMINRMHKCSQGWELVADAPNE